MLPLIKVQQMHVRNLKSLKRLEVSLLHELTDPSTSSTCMIGRSSVL